MYPVGDLTCLRTRNGSYSSREGMCDGHELAEAAPVTWWGHPTTRAHDEPVLRRICEMVGMHRSSRDVRDACLKISCVVSQLRTTRRETDDGGREDWRKGCTKG